MKAAYIEKVGPPENIHFGDLPKPKPSGSQVLVRVEAVAVNPIDTYIRAGTVAMDFPKPLVVGCDLAGVVEAVGADVARLKVGDRVWGSNQGLLGRQGTFAEFAAVEERWLYPIPEGVASQEAAAIALVGITAHLGLFRCAQLKVGESVFVHGGCGGVASCVVQMAHAVGARVMTTAGSDEKAQVCRRLGANAVINYKAGGIDEALEKFGPIDVWWEILREPDLERAVARLAPRGRIILMAGREARPVFPVGPFYLKDASVHGMAMFNAPAEEQRKCAAEINRWLAKGKLRALIGRVMKLSETAAAHRLQEESTLQKKGGLMGKIVLEP
jgi:NADPH2:quinone reductase